MLRSFFCLLMVLQSLSGTVMQPQARMIIGLKTGALLRMHVIAHDDSEEMQRIKLCVRDAVRHAYDQNCPDPAASMQLNTFAILPLLTAAAEESARAEGFTGPVRVTLETALFDERSLGTYTLPAGEYPALIIHLGDAQGQNWWGLIDPALAFDFASLSTCDQPFVLDWSLKGFFQALAGGVKKHA